MLTLILIALSFLISVSIANVHVRIGNDPDISTHTECGYIDRQGGHFSRRDSYSRGYVDMGMHMMDSSSDQVHVLIVYCVHSPLIGRYVSLQKAPNARDVTELLLCEVMVLGYQYRGKSQKCFNSPGVWKGDSDAIGLV